MEQKFLEIFELRYQKVLNSSEIIYKTLASYNEMAFSRKKMLKEAECYIQSLIVLSLIKSNELTIETLEQLNDLTEYEFAFKKVKLRKVKELDEKIISQINTIANEAIKIEPLFIKAASFFDKAISKMDGIEKISGCKIIENCLLAMLLHVRNIDEQDDIINKYQNDIQIIYKYIER